MYRRDFRTPTLALLTALSCLALVGGWSAPPLAAEEFDQKSVELLDKYVEATGGQEAYDAIKNRVIRAELSLPSVGPIGTMTAYSAQPDQFYAVIETGSGENKQKLQRGWNGKTAWMIEPAFGARILEGLEKAAVIRDSTQDRFAQWRELFEKAEYAGQVELDGKKMDKVVLTFKPLEPNLKESPVTVLFDPATGLIKQYNTELIGPQSLVEVTVVLDDYKKADGVLLAHKMVLNVEGRDRVIQVVSVESNTQIPPDTFILPRPIQELLVK